MKKIFSRLPVIPAAWMIAGIAGFFPAEPVTGQDPESPGLALPEGFHASKVTEEAGRARHIAVNQQGDIYVKLERLQDGKGILMFSDPDGDGQAELEAAFGDYGGTGIRIRDGHLYASSNSEVFRYRLDEQERVIDTGKSERIVTGLIDRRQHASKSITFDDEGNIYVNIGAYSNACQEQDRTKDSPGMMPCPILDSAGGIWRFRADVLDQTYGDGLRYATGLRNVVGLDWNTQVNKLFVTQHGRDMLHDHYADLFDDVKTAIELPAEAMYRIEEGADCGWPYVYYDHIQKKNILAPEYGGDGKKEGDADVEDPVYAFPGHLAPNDLLFYTGDMFPERYRNGAFIAFHGSWNRAPENQEGFLVAFLPFENGEPSGDWEIFADGFAGSDEVASPGDAEHRPCGLAQGPDGSLYVSDDAGGAIFRITYGQ